MNEDRSMERLNARLRIVQLIGLGFIALTAIAWVVLSQLRVDLTGLLLGELGGAWVVFSLIHQGHRNDGMQGTALFASGMMGMFGRVIALVAVMIIAEKWRAHVNPYFALVGYMLGFVLIYAGLYGYARNQTSDS